MASNTQINPGMTISLNGKLYRVESSVKVTVTKGAPFIKTKLKNLVNGEVIEKNFKPDQPVKEVALIERNLEFLYLEGKDYLFLSTDTLDQVLVPASIVSDRAHFLKEGVQVRASFYGDTIFSIELPQFLELMISRTEGGSEGKVGASSATKIAILETGARIEVPPFIDAGDIIKVDTKMGDYIQRV